MLYRFIFILFVFTFTPDLTKAQELNNTFFELHGSIIGKSKKYIFISYNNDKNVEIIDSIKIINKKFFYKGFISNPVKVFISNNSEFTLDGLNSAIIYLEPKKINIDIDLNNFKILRVHGSKTHNEYLELEELRKKTYIKRAFLNNIIRNCYAEINSTTDIKFKKKIQEKIDSLDNLNNENDDKELQTEFEYVKLNPSSYVSLDILKFKFKYKEGFKQYDTYNALFHSLDLNIQNSESGKKMNHDLTNFKNSSNGSLAPDFTVKDIENNTLTLSDFRNKKYVLMDFWASWCGPCREDFPFLKELYLKYNNKGFEIINVSRDENLESWKKAIMKDNIGTWKHFSINENKSSIEKLYFVTAIPQKILIDKEGKIIGRWKGGGEKNANEIKKLLEEIFKK